jgi:hypothetical protein
MDAIRYTTNSTVPLVFEIDSITVSDLPSIVPEPGSIAALASGLIGFAGFMIRKRKA